MDVRNGIEVRLSSGLTPAEADEVRALVAASPAGSYLQQPDWPELCPPPPRHRYVGLRAYLGQELIGWAQVRLSPLAAGFRLASLRRGPVTMDIETLRLVVPAFAGALARHHVCSMVVNPRWSGPAADEATRCLAALGATVLPDRAQTIHRTTLLADLSGTPADLRGRLKQRCRRQIARCEKMGLQVRPAASVDEAMLYEPVLQGFHRRRGLPTDAIPPFPGSGK
ncbi:MAG: hypothetical protein R3D63_13310 [Paracoccaceae bacterium]